MTNLKTKALGLLLVSGLAFGVRVEKKMSEYKKLTPEEIKERISKLPEKNRCVVADNATERPFQNEYWDNHEEGIYVDVASGEPLFSSQDKFDSGSGWPSFTKPIEKKSIIEKKDASHGMIRTEVRSESGHLGHVFDDGPRDKGGLRYCINSAALRFIAKKDMEKEGYGKYLEIFKGKK